MSLRPVMMASGRRLYERHSEPHRDKWPVHTIGGTQIRSMPGLVTAVPEGLRAECSRPNAEIASLQTHDYPSN